MSSHVGVYFDADGNVACIVRPHFDVPGYQVTEKDFAAHNYKGLTRAVIATEDYSGKPPINIDGKAVYLDLAKVALAEVAKVDAELASTIQAKTNAVDAAIALAVAADAAAELGVAVP